MKWTCRALRQCIVILNFFEMLKNFFTLFIYFLTPPLDALNLGNKNVDSIVQSVFVRT
jgi:hypothetical protein